LERIYPALELPYQGSVTLTDAGYARANEQTSESLKRANFHEKAHSVKADVAAS
jgi:hypothetical protein